jgi:hypothetical protein
MGAKQFHSDGQAARHNDLTKLRVAFDTFANEHKTGYAFVDKWRRIYCMESLVRWRRYKILLITSSDVKQPTLQMWTKCLIMIIN